MYLIRIKMWEKHTCDTGCESEGNWLDLAGPFYHVVPQGLNSVHRS